jgi:transcription elongation factor Elf1
MMNVNETFEFLLGQLAYAGGEVLKFSTDHRNELPSESVTVLESFDIVQKTNPTNNLVCDGCEQHCDMPVQIRTFTNKPTRAFIVCDKRDDIGRVQVDIERLNQWQVSAHQIAMIVANLYGHSKPPVQKNGLWQIGLLEGKNTGMLLLDFYTEDGAQCVINERRVPLVEVMTFDGKNFKLDMERLKKMATAGVQSRGISIKRELQKAATQALYSDWYEEYIKMKREHPKYNDEKISDLISKLTVGNGKSPEYIRRNMKTKK